MLIKIYSAMGLLGDCLDSNNFTIKWEILVETAKMIEMPMVDVSPMNPHWYIESYVIVNIVLEVGLGVFDKDARLWILSREINKFGSFDYLNVIRTEFDLTEELFPMQNVNLAVWNLLMEVQHD